MPPACAGAVPFNIITGAADVYIAAVGTAFPAVNATPSGSWNNLGKTDGGVTIRHSQNIELITADQNTGPVKAIRTEEGLEIEMALMEVTLENYARTLSDITVTTITGPPAEKSLSPRRGRCVGRHALLIRGDSPYGAFNMQYDVPVVVQTEDPEVAFTKDDKVTLNVVWTAIEDLTAGTEAARFGTIHAQTA